MLLQRRIAVRAFGHLQYSPAPLPRSFSFSFGWKNSDGSVRDDGVKSEEDTGAPRGIYEEECAAIKVRQEESERRGEAEVDQDKHLSPARHPRLPLILLLLLFLVLLLLLFLKFYFFFSLFFFFFLTRSFVFLVLFLCGDDLLRPTLSRECPNISQVEPFQFSARSTNLPPVPSFGGLFSLYPLRGLLRQLLTS